MRKTVLLLSAMILIFNGIAQTETVRDIIKSKIESGIDTKTISADGIVLNTQDFLHNYYNSMSYAAEWTDQKNIDDLVNNLKDSYNEGLLPEDYHLNRIEKLISDPEIDSDARKKADLDLLLTDATMLYGTHLIVGKVDQSKIRKGWDVPPNSLPKNEGALLREALINNTISNTLSIAKPDNFMYTHLRNGLRDYRRISSEGGWPKVDAGETLKLGMKDKCVIDIRAYLMITGDLSDKIESNNDSIYDADVQDAVSRFQYRHNLSQDGVLGKGTLEQINIPVEKRIDEIRINLERARWVIHHLPDDFLVVNIAGYNVRRITNDSIVYFSRVIVGKNYHESPIFKGDLSYIEINPTWTLPYSIATRETLPKLKKDPDYLSKKNMIIMDRNGKELDPSTIDFNSLSPGNFPYTLRQTAGPHNALGEVKFMFPNSYAVYLHDTPARSLFNREERAFSHGCIRLDKKWELLMSLMHNPEEWNMVKINEILKSEKTTRVNLSTPIEILLLYWTAGADKQDNIYFNKDVYNRDDLVLKELNKPLVFRKVDN